MNPFEQAKAAQPLASAATSAIRQGKNGSVDCKNMAIQYEATLMQQADDNTDLGMAGHPQAWKKFNSACMLYKTVAINLISKNCAH